MKPMFEAWKDHISRLPRAEADFERWLFVKIAGVLFGDKSGELLVLRSGQFPLSRRQRLRRIAKLSRSWQISCLLLNRSREGLKVIVYDPERTKDALRRVPDTIMSRLGYETDIGAHGFLSEIKRRWHHTGRIPHEVGLALGYPLKDVIGFMGLYPLRYTGGCGWRIYGNPTRSVRKSRRFRQAKERAIAFLKH
jgi:hypothetical protein